ncbi:ABC-F family ATP-binding cassette domain-containing protein [Fimbriimonas ginsengisoli]|uniref:ABC transporter-like protein n=1 Tax=Fimbriimonas ginsengisoli Gsoil 348 TaxID=661478 RepID=A0A068NLD5_FIMGI|nr:ABC-F family ATP-binding cassette domain-containing protein [Fimbriimonas ginsengisoli]AIE84388.1 ABC transporter-like protein [Fimbriimonas ginsengisoli Gsoil 348]
MILSVSNVAKSFGVDRVLTGVTFRIDAREKVALVGRNGTGKTTLLKIITRQMEPDSGGVQLAKGAKVGYLRQEAPVSLGRTVIEEAESAVERQLELRARMAELEQRLENGPTEEELDEYALIHEHFLEAEGYSAENDVRVVLQRMGFTEDEFDKPTAKLSGGEKTRLAIARLLLEEPDLLILDEPTNHLDLQATEWLEGWLRQYHGAVLLVSHDRTFLDNTAERVVEMRDGTVKTYPGPFPKYLELRAADEARQAEVAKRQEMEIAKMDEFVRRFMNSQRTAQARGRQKIMNRLIESKVNAPKMEKGMKGGFAEPKRSGDTVMATEKLTVGFPAGDEEPVVLFKDLDWTVRFGERWGVIGENGSGKSTLMKVVLDQLEPLAGRARLGSNVVCGYFTQDGVDLDPEVSPLHTMVWDLDLKPPEARNLLGRYLITGDDVYRPIKTLSGGEKNKLSLAKLTHLNPNLLILDEPTNHLDMASREALAEILREYKGTLVLVSHDRHLLAEVTDHTLDIRRAGPIQYPGSYLEYRNRANKPAQTPKKEVPPAPIIPKLLDGKKAPQEPALSPRELSKEIGRLEKVVAGIESEIEDREAELKEVEDRLANLDPSADVFALTREHQQLKEELEGTLAAWEEHSTRLERLIASRG